MLQRDALIRFASTYTRKLAFKLVAAFSCFYPGAQSVPGVRCNETHVIRSSCRLRVSGAQEKPYECSQPTATVAKRCIWGLKNTFLPLRLQLNQYSSRYKESRVCSLEHRIDQKPSQSVTFGVRKLHFDKHHAHVISLPKAHFGGRSDMIPSPAPL